VSTALDHVRPAIRVPRPGRVLDLARSRLDRTTIDPATVGVLLERYGLSATGRPERLSLRSRNVSVVVPTSSGREVVKRYRDRWAAPAIEHEHSILAGLESAGFPAVRVERTPSDETVIELPEGRFALFAFEPGVNLAGYLASRSRMRRSWTAAGRLLAAFHRVLEGFVPAGRHHLGYASYEGVRARDLEWHLDVLEELAGGRRPTGGDDPTERWLRRESARMGAHLIELSEVLEDAALPRTVIHGDYGIHNILFRPDGTAVVTDLELSRIDWPAIDLVSVLSRTKPPYGRVFLEAYEQDAPPTAHERRLLPVVWRFHRLSGAVRSWLTASETGAARPLLKARDRVIEADRVAEVGLDPWLG
jgi:Ser/Thr protein kinase RdoA (MazF antagonist)